MICLGIESTAHTFGAGIMDDKGNVLANEKSSYTTEEGGIIPYEAAEHHVQNCDKVIKKALNKAELNLRDIDLVAFSQGPGIGNSLRVGAFTARSIAKMHKKPIIGVNHMISHIAIGELMTTAKDPVFLYVSGANTQVIAYEAGKYRVFGETLDIGVGNFIDSFARYLGLGFPGGPKIQELAEKSKNYIELPYTVKGMDVSFGGVLTNLKNKYDSGKYKKEDLCYSLQETIFAMLLEISERAMFHTGKKELLLGGGVACNKRLQEMSKDMCKANGFKFFVPENSVLVDNGLMIAQLGLLSYKSGNRMKIKDTEIRPYERTEDIKVTWK